VGDAIQSYAPLWAILVSLGAVPLILASGGRPNVREFWTLAAGILEFAVVLSLLPNVRDGAVVGTTPFELAPGIGLALQADSLGVFFALIASGMWILTSIYSIGYMRTTRERNQTRYFASFALSLSATIGVAFAGNLLTFIFFFELLTLATYPLVIHKESPEALRAGRRYLAYSLTAGVCLIGGAAWLYQTAGTLDFRPGGVLGEADLSGTLVPLAFLLFVAGVGVKSAIMPLHSWLPAAMVAPAPVSALLHAVAVVKSGVFGMVRVVGYVFGPEIVSAYGLDQILAWAAGATILLSSILALRQDSLKRRLAYSTIGHLSYIVLGIASLGREAWTGGVFHISTHAFMKITLFFAAGAIYARANKEHVSQLDGIGRAMPWTLGAFALGAMGLVGIPPVSGFFSKWFLATGTLAAGWPAAHALYVLSGLLNAAYLFPIVYRGFFCESTEFPEYAEASPLMVVPLVLTALMALALGLFPNLFFHFFDLAGDVAVSVIGGVQ
jgi:multicomponent Na+:H+ antiporter subunit D